MFLQYKFLVDALGTSRLGVWSLVLAMTSLSRLGDLGFTGAVAIFVAKYDGARNPRAVVEVVHTSLIWVAASMGALSILLVPFTRLFLQYSLPASDMAAATGLIVPCVISFWLTSLASVYLGALDGYRRTDIRAAIQLLGGAVYYAATVAFVSMSGFAGLGSAQLLQAVVLLVAACVFFCRNSSHDPMRPRWYRERFREMWRFSRDSQLIAIANVFFDPITKAALARFGGLSETAIFEIASRYVVQVRTLIGAAYNVVVPVIARVSDHGTL